MLGQLVFPVIQGFIAFVVMIVILLMVLRLIFNYTDPNPFGAIGRFAFKLKRFTDRIVHPAAVVLAQFRIDTRLAPFITILVACVIGYFTLQLFGGVLGMIDGITEGVRRASITLVVGYLLVGFLTIYSLLIVIRIVFSWVLGFTNPVMRFLRKITDPILEPFRRMIPPLGVFDISAIIVLLLLNFLKIAVAAVLLG
ncbi:MAG TPA: YggT family protein [Pyrinomonadaceae bacterium]|nr:YggT family protein [Pyrinomonadaceae bacterium]